MPERRKLIAFDEETWAALDLLSRDSVKSIQELADEAFTDLLKKHRRPVTLKEALRQSLRREPANDPEPAKPSPGAEKTTAPARRVRRNGQRKRG